MIILSRLMLAAARGRGSFGVGGRGAGGCCCFGVCKDQT